MSFTILNKNLRKYDDRTLSDLLRSGLLNAADVEIDIEKCIEPLLIQWLNNYDFDTSQQPIGIFFTLLTVIAHVAHNISILQWNKIQKKLNIYSFILGISGACKSGFIRPVRAAYTAMIDFLRQYNLGDRESYNSLVDSFTTAGLYDQLVQSTDVLVLQEEIDTTLHNMGFYVPTGNDGRQLLCSLWEGLDDNKKTKSYRQNIRHSHLTLCGASTGKSFTPLIRECLDDLPTDGVIDRCLILVVPYSRFTRDSLKPKDLTKPTISQILLCTSILGERELIFDDDAYNIINAYTDDLTHRAASFYRTSPRFTSYLAKQPTQVIKLCGLMTIIHIVTNVLSHLHLTLNEETDHGLNLIFYNQLHTFIQQRIPYVIKVTRESVNRAIYMHGFLYEQSERLLHLNTHDNNNVPQIKLTGEQLHKHLMREILMMRNIIVMTNVIYSIPGLTHVHRSLVKNALEQLVIEHLLLADYFVITSTNRPIFCYIKILPKLNDPVDHETISKKLEKHNLSLEEYMMLNRNYSLPKDNRFNELARQILAMPSYIAVCGEQYGHQLNSQHASTIGNSQYNISSSNVTTPRQEYLQSSRSPLLMNTQNSRSSLNSSNTNKRSISPLLIDTYTSTSNSVNTNNIVHQHIQRNSKQNIYSITSSSSQDISQPLHRITDNDDDTSIISNRITRNTTTTNALASSTSNNRKFFKTRMRRTISIASGISNISSDSDTI